YELLGGLHRTQVSLSEYFAYRAGAEQSPADVAAFCERMREQHGSTVFEGKVAVRSLDDDVRLAREVRAAIGPDCTLRLDANMGWSLDTARGALSLLEPFEIANVEEPVAASLDDRGRDPRRPVLAGGWGCSGTRRPGARGRARRAGASALRRALRARGLVRPLRRPRPSALLTEDQELVSE